MSGTRNLEELKTQALTCIEAAYDKGYRAARLDASEYERGLKDAEKAIKRVLNEPSKGGLYANELQEIFRTKGIVTVLLTHSVSEIIEKIREYDEKKAEKNASPDDEIHAGDEIYCINPNYKYVVLRIFDDGEIRALSNRGLTESFTFGQVHKTGRNYPVTEILEGLKNGGE